MWSQINPSEKIYFEEKLSTSDKSRAIVTGHFKGALNESLYYKRIYPIDFYNTNELASKHIIILHEATGHHSLNLDFADYLSRKNVLVSLPDLKGHGLSGGVRGHLESFEGMCFELIQFIKMSSELSHEKPIIVGTGFSALMILKLYQIYNFPVREHLSGIVLINPLLAPSHNFPQKLIEITNNFREIFGPVRMPYKFTGSLFSRDPLWINAYNSDALVNNRLTFSFLRETLRESEELMKTSYFIDIPTLALSSDAGAFVNHTKFKLFQKGIEKNILSEGPYTNHAHDLLNDLQRDRVFNDIYTWLMLLKRNW